MAAFVETKTKIEDNQSSRDDLLRNTGNLLVDFIRTNGGDRNISQLHEDLKKLLKGYSTEEKYQIALTALAVLGAGTGGSSSSKKGKKNKGGNFGDSLGFLAGKGGSGDYGDW